jgi:PKD repeat protein
MVIAGSASATHFSGGEIYWECIGTNQFRIRLVVYRDCAGIEVDPSYNLQLTGPCGNRTLNVSTPGGVEISQLCDLELPNSTCNGGSLPGIQQYIYTGTITLPPCNSWTISWTNIYRNNAIVNLTNPGTREMYITGVLNSATAPCNDSPTFTNTAIPYVCMGYPVSYSYGAVDAEADSLSYSLIGARMVNGNPVPYVAPFTPLVPIPGLTIDPVSGLVNFTLNVQGNWVVVVLVTQYDANGNVIGTIMRDMQFVAYPCSNIPPDAATGLVTNLTGGAVQTGPRSIQVCEFGNFCFDMVISDANVTNVLDAFSNVGLTLPGATFSFTGTNPITATVCWTAAANTSGFFPFIVNVDDGACPISAFQTYVYSIQVLPGLYATLIGEDEQCLGTGDGSLMTDVTVGLPPYTYAWSTGATTAGITAGAGSYSVVVSDDNGCVSQPLTGTIGTNGLPNEADAGPDLVGCIGAFPVQLSGTVVNATSGSWSGGTGTFSGTGLNPGYTPSAAEIAAGGVTLTLTSTGNSTCPPAQDQVFINIPNGFANTTVDAVDAVCFGTNTGSASVVPANPAFTYLWNDPAGQTTATASNLGAGTYTVTITDAFGCDTQLSANIGPLAALSIASLTATDEACLGSGDGSATVTVTGGTPPYSYLWSNGANTPGITATSGTYTVSITDANNCAPASASVTIDAQGLPNQADAGPDLVGCIGAFPVQLTGAVVNATGGTWSGGSGTFNGAGLNPGYTPSSAEIAAGGVTLTLTSTGNSTCPPAQDQVFINIPNSFANTTVDAVDAVCFGTNTGSASVVPANPAFTYLWNDPAGQTTATANNLGAGNYTVTITDGFGCDTQLSANIGPVAALSIASLTATDEACLGNGDGTATVTVTGGTPPYSYVWSNGATIPSISATSGTYTVSITDANNCAPASGSITITPQGLPNVANAGPDLVGCLNAFPISIQGSVTNATGASWSGGNGTISGTGASIQYFPNTSEVIAGGVTLVLTTTGNNTCPPDQDSVFIALSNSFLTAGLSTTAPLCNGAQNGSIIYAPELGGLSYQWNDPAAQTTASASGLTAGTYSITVSDALGCDTTLSATLIDPPVLATTAVISTDVTCNGGNNGAVQLTVTGGTPAYTVNWNSGGMGLTQANLSAGSYTATITDANGCAITATATIDQPQPLTLTAQVPDTVCVNAPVTLTAQAQGGSGNYVYTWVGLGSGPMLTAAFNLSQLVTVTVTDQLGCTSPAVQHPVTVLNLNTATFLAYGDTTVCPGGVATVGAVFGNYPGTSSLLWTPTGQVGTGPFTHPITGDQDLTVTVTDQCGNTRTDVVQLRLDVPPAIQLPPIIAEGCAPLSVQLPNLGLASGISYLWTLGNGQTSTAVAPTVIYQAGSYQVGLTVTTAVGCSSTAPSTGAVIAHLPPTAAFTASAWTADIDNAVIQFTDQSTGTISSHEWLFGDGGTSDAQNPSHQFLEVGTFEVELYVEDAYGCSDMASGTITINPVYDVTVPNAFTPNANGGGGGGWIPGDLSNDVFYPFARFVDEFRMRIFNRWGELIFESTDIRQGWDGYYRGQLSPQDVYVVQTWVQFVDGKEVVKLTDLTLFR